MLEPEALSEEKADCACAGGTCAAMPMVVSPPLASARRLRAATSYSSRPR